MAADVAPAAAPAASRARWALPVAVAVVVFGVDVACPSGMTADSIRAVGVGVSMLHWHTIALDHLRPLVDPGYAITTVHGHAYPYFPWAVSLFALPWVAGFDVLHKLGVGQGSVALERTGHDWELQVVSMAAVIAAAAVFVYATACRLLPGLRRGAARRWAAVCALVFVFTTPVWSTAGRSMWQQGPSILCLSAALFFAVRADQGERGFAAMGAALACGYAVRPTDAVPLGVLMLWVLVAHPRRLWAAVAGAAGPLAVFVAVNQVAYGQPLSPYYTAGQGFALSRRFAVALAGNLVSPARGLVWYFPLGLLAVAGVVVLVRGGRFTRLWQALCVIPVVHWVVISAFKHWWGGDSYGPRLFADMVPVLTVLAMPAVGWLVERAPPRRTVPRRRHQVAVAATVVAGVFGLAVNAQGAVLRSAWCWNSEPTNVDTNPSRLWDWSDPQFLRGVRRLVWGPDRHSELVRDGVDLIGCPVEPVRP